MVKLITLNQLTLNILFLMLKTLKIITYLFTALLIAGLIWLAWDTVAALNHFTLISFSAVATYSLFIWWLYLRLSNLGLIINSVISFLVLLPFIIHLIALWSPDTLEKSWPLLLSMLLFQSGLGMLALLGLFQRNRTKSVLNGITGFIIALFFAVFMIAVLLKIDLEAVYSYLTIGIVIVSILFLVTLLLGKTEKH